MGNASSTRSSKSAWKRISTGLFIFASALTIAGCATSTPLSPAPPIPANLVQECPPLTPLEGKTGAHVLRKLIEVGQQYNECRAIHGALVKAVQ